MTRRASPSASSSPPPDDTSRPIPALPAWKAFVVQFTRESDASAVFAGRVEHLSSGRRLTFASADQLTVILRQLLAEVTAPIE